MRIEEFAQAVRSVSAENFHVETYAAWALITNWAQPFHSNVTGRRPAKKPFEIVRERECAAQNETILSRLSSTIVFW